jgi:hypothetical protein
LGSTALLDPQDRIRRGVLRQLLDYFVIREPVMRSWKLALRTAGFFTVLLIMTSPTSFAESRDRETVGSQAVDAYKRGEYQAALPLAKTYTELTKQEVGDDHRDYAFALLLQAQILYHLGGRLGEDVDHLYEQGIRIFRSHRVNGSADLANALNSQTEYFIFRGRLQEATGSAQEAIKVQEQNSNAPHALAVSVALLGDVYSDQSQYDQSNIQYRRARELLERDQTGDPSDLAQVLKRLADCDINLGNYQEADELVGRAVALLSQSKSNTDPGLASLAKTAARLNEETGNLTQAEDILQTGFQIELRNGDEQTIGQYLVDVAAFFGRHGDYAKAEDVLKRALTYLDKGGPESLALASALTSLATVELELGLSDLQPAELAGRAHKIRLEILGETHPDTIQALMNGIEALVAMKDEDALWIYEMELVSTCTALGKAVPSGDPGTVLCLNNLGHLFLLERKFDDASAVLNRAVDLATHVYGRENPETARILINLASTYEPKSDFDKASALLQEAIATLRKTLGPWHNLIATAVNNLAWLRHSESNPTEAVKLFREAADIEVHRFMNEDRIGNLEGAQSETVSHAHHVFFGYVDAAYDLAQADAVQKSSLTEESFRMWQWALQSAAGTALNRMSARFATIGGSQSKDQLSKLVREHQDLSAKLAALDRRIVDAASDPNPRASDEQRSQWREQFAATQHALDKLDQGFPEDYTTLVNPRPLAIADVQGLLQPNEALIQFAFGQAGSYAWLVTKNQIEWRKIELKSDQLTQLVRALRCGLDEGGEWRFNLKWYARHDYCRPFENEYNQSGVPPFQFDVAYDLYFKLFGPFKTDLRNKQLLVVPAADLASLPLSVLLTARLDPAVAGIERYQTAKWLGLERPLVTLPTVASLQAIRGLGRSRPRPPFDYIGIGNPLLKGEPGDPRDAKNARRAQEYTNCGRVPIAVNDSEERHKGPISIGSLASGNATNVEAELRQAPLPETAEEICDIARQLKVVPNKENDAIWIGRRATEGNVKKLSEDGALSQYSTIHFATHGVIAAESEKILNAGAEPGLLLTPPTDSNSQKTLDRDDGILSASEVAQLNLNADWVILSACNTAAPNDGGGEALSGLARAFFYAGASALLASHWYVDSDASVKLMTRAFLELKANPGITRAEAMRRSMAALTKDKTRPKNWLTAAHPAVWAPFVLVGEGGAAR